MSGTLRPGTFIRLDETAAQLGVSITPVREALLKLSGEGMVQLEPHRGHVVVPLSRKDIEDIFWLQATIARELVRTTAANITDAEIDELSRPERRTGRRPWPSGIRMPSSAPSSRSTAPSTGRRTASSWPGSCCTPRATCRRWSTPADPGWGADAVENHRKLIDALRARDADAVAVLTEWQFTDGARAAHREAREDRDVGLTGSAGQVLGAGLEVAGQVIEGVVDNLLHHGGRDRQRGLDVHVHRQQ